MLALLDDTSSCAVRCLKNTMKQVLSMEEEGIDLTEKISNTEFYIYDH
jgi:hypothetical protein